MQYTVNSEVKARDSEDLDWKRLWSDYIAEANPNPSLTGAIPLLTRTGTLGCWVSPLARCVPP